MVQGEIPELNVEVASLSGVCIASSMALKYAYANIKSGLSKNAVVTGSEVASHHLRSENYTQYEGRSAEELEAKPEYCFEQDFLRWMLSDGAAALWLSDTQAKGLSLEIDWIATRSYSNELPPCMYLGIDPAAEDPRQATWAQLSRKESAQKKILNIAQDVKLLDKHIVEFTLKRALSEIRKEKGLLPGDVDYFIPHYSSGYFREKVYNALNEIDFTIPYEKWFTSLPERGNIGSASFFVYLCDFLARTDVKEGQKVLAFIPESSRFSSCFVLLTVRKNADE
jgi:3-oxoacyl-[acyl-carrier-protein] synthase-3